MKMKRVKKRRTGQIMLEFTKTRLNLRKIYEKVRKKEGSGPIMSEYNEN